MDYRAEARRILEVIKTHDGETAMSLAIKHWWESAYNAGRMSVQAVTVQVPTQVVSAPAVTAPGGITPEAAEAMARNPGLPWKLPGMAGPHETVDEKVKAQMAQGGQSVVQDDGRVPPVGNQGEQRGLETSAVGSGSGLGSVPMHPSVGGDGSNPMGPGFEGNAATPSVSLADVNAQASAGAPGLPPGLPVTKQGSY